MDDMTESKGSLLRKLLEECRGLKAVLPYDFSKVDLAMLDFSGANRNLDNIDTSNSEEFNRYVMGVISGQGATVGVGRYNEERVTYRHSALFRGEGEPRSVHLGIDLFVERGTSVHAPLASTVHSYANNGGVGNYGPTIILQHELQGLRFWSLYGHLTIDSLMGYREGMELSSGLAFGRVGSTEENGSWPPHLHFQIIVDIGEWKGDFPGVATLSQRQYFLELCPDPNMILGIPGL
jgi:murein DD-endopeptidase MepM/ murein hydrolase activator NlpD